MAAKNQFNIYTTYYESFLALSVSIRVEKHQLMMETPISSQAPVLRCRPDITFTTEYLKESLSAVCPVLGVHNVARVRQGAALPLVEVDFTDEKALERFCKSISNGVIQSRLQDRLGQNFWGSVHEIAVTLKLHLIMPNAEKKNPVFREVTTANCRECFSLIRESALFEFGATHGIEETIEIKLEFENSDLSDLLKELAEVAAHWYTVGLFLKIDYFRLDAIRNDTCGRTNQSMECLREMLATWLRGTDASPAALVQALRSAGVIGLAKKMAVKYGVSVFTIESEVVEPHQSNPRNMTADLLIKAFTQLVEHASQDSRPQSIPDCLSALANQRERIIIKDTQHSALEEQLRELNDSEADVKQSFKQAKSSLESVKDQVDKLRKEQKSLVEKRERKELSKRWFIELRESKTGEDLVQLNQMIKDTEEAVAELSNQMDELKTKIRAQNEQVAEMSAQLVQKENEKKQLEIMIDEVQKEKSSLEKKLEEDRKTFEIEIQIMLYAEQKLSKVSPEKKHEEEKRKSENELSQTTHSKDHDEEDGEDCGGGNGGDHARGREDGKDHGERNSEDDKEMVPKSTMDTEEEGSTIAPDPPFLTDSDSDDEPTSQSKTSESPVEWWFPFGGMVTRGGVKTSSLAVEGLNREEIGIEEIFVPNEAESNGQ